MNSNQKHFSQWGKPGMVNDSQPNHLGNSHSLFGQRSKQLQDSYVAVRNQPLPQPKIMLSDGMMRGRYALMEAQDPFKDARFATDAAKQKKELSFKGLSSFSRFYSKETVTPETIAADIGASMFTNRDNLAPSGNSVQVDGDTVMHTRTTEQFDQSQEIHDNQGMSQDNFVQHGVMKGRGAKESTKQVGRIFDSGF